MEDCVEATYLYLSQVDLKLLNNWKHSCADCVRNSFSISKNCTDGELNVCCNFIRIRQSFLGFLVFLRTDDKKKEGEGRGKIWRKVEHLCSYTREDTRGKKRILNVSQESGWSSTRWSAFIGKVDGDTGPPAMVSISSSSISFFSPERKKE